MKIKIQSKCPYCESKDLSDGKSDFIISNGGEKLIQFCNDCHKEWFIDEEENK
ncbi:MAG: hypothetical protein ACTSRZ_17985 [Promethearchaeota archaeon]